jgi:hypothetical protein
MIALADPIDLDTLRIRHEFLVHPDLRVSVNGAASRVDTTPHYALAALESLVFEGFLIRSPDGQYARAQATVA